MTGSSDTEVTTMSFRFKMTSVTSSVTPGDGVELVQRVVEAHRGDGGARDRRQQGATQRVADRVAEAGLERADGEPLTVPFRLAERLDGGALDDQHGDPFVAAWRLVGGYLE